jgi:hypothetical protein
VKARIDTIANRYFAAQQRSQAIANELAGLRGAITSGNASIARVRATAVAAAVSMYRSQPRDYMLGTDGAPGNSGALDDARSEVFARQASQRNDEVINRYVRAISALRDDEDRLVTRQREAQQVEEQLRGQASELDRQLAEDKGNYAAVLAARRAAATSATASGPTPTAPGGGTDAGSPAAPSTGATGTSGSPSTGATTPPTTPVTSPPPPPPSGSNSHHNDPFLSCVRQRESRGYYGAVNGGGYYGAYQFAIRTWNITASHAGRPQLIGVRPDRASPWDQDELAWTLYQWQGKGPWGGHCP